MSSTVTSLARATKAIGAIVLLVILLVPLGTPSYALSTNSTKTPIRHLINVFFENHTFDNYFGTYPVDPSSPRQSIIASLSTPVNLLSNSSLMDELHAIPAGTFSTVDPIEGNTAYHIEWNRGKMNGFVQGGGPASMTYFTASQLGPIWDLAEEYSLGDMYFAPALSESDPNTMYYLAGYTPVINDYGPPPSIPYSQSIFGELDAYGVSYGLFIPYQNESTSYSEWSLIDGMNSHLSNIFSWSTFVSDLQSGNVPSVSWLFSQDDNGTDQGPPVNILGGEMWLMYMINEIEASPIWNSTAVTITWDDPGGYFDHVAPPTVDGAQLGFRLPLIIVSPFAKEDYISSTVLTHSSILAFIDYNWELPALNGYVSQVNVPLDFFDFGTPYVGGTIPRESITFSFGNNFPIPQQPYINLPKDFRKLNISDTFPMEPQYGLSTLPYASHGAISFTLFSTSSQLFVTENTVTMPFYASSYFVALVIIADIALLLWGTRIGRKREG
jgi:phospholipase C